MRTPLYLKIVGWFLLNLLLLAAAVLLFMRTQFDFDLNGLVSGRAGSQVDAVSRLIEGELRRTEPSGWDAVLRHFDTAVGVSFSIRRPDGAPVAGVTHALPPEVQERFTNLPFPLPPPPRDRPPPNGNPPPPPPPPRFEKALVHTRDPDAYWAVVQIGLPGDKGNQRQNPGILLVRADSLNAGGLFFDIKPWLFAGLAMVVGSALFWLPFVRRITGALSRMTEATRRIADGNFDVKIQRHARDELGSLADSINRMAARLDGFVSGQKRFLGDTAHELCAPLSRIQVALGILEARAPEDQQASIADVREEADQMSSLVNELLAFSKASLDTHDVRCGPVDVGVVAARAVRREAGASGVAVETAGDLRVMGDATLLERALANLIRNAIRHSGGSGIEISAQRDGAEDVVISVADSGPGVPEESIPKLFDPFFRPDASRSRETGGAGLGLAIVKNCVELCGGSVSCRNRPSGGLEVLLRLKAAT